MRLLLLTFALCALIASMGCSNREKKLPAGRDTIDAPLQQISGSTLFFYEKGVKRWRLDAEIMRKYLEGTQITEVIPVRLSLYDSAGETGTRVMADSGNVNADQDSFYIWGNVHVLTPEQLQIQAENLSWNKRAKRVTSQDYVKITTQNGDVLKGKGLSSREDFSTWELHEQVQGTFPDFKNRLESQDSFLSTASPPDSSADTSSTAQTPAPAGQEEQ